MDPVFERFFDMIQGFGGSPGNYGNFGAGPSGPGSPRNPGSPGHPDDGDHFFGRDHAHEPPGMPHVHHTTFRSTGGGTASITIVSGPVHHRRLGDGPMGRGLADPFQMYRIPVLTDRDMALTI
jgi:hypothetical protein